jgi:hypothetical protein
MIQKKECNVINVTSVENVVKVCQITNSINLRMFVSYYCYYYYHYHHHHNPRHHLYAWHYNYILEHKQYFYGILCCSCSVFTMSATCNVISPVKYVLYFYISTFRSMCAVPNGIFEYCFATAVKKTGNKPGNIPNLSSSGIHKSRPDMVAVKTSTSPL